MNISRLLSKLIRLPLDFVLDTIAPQDPMVRRIESMTPSDFLGNTRRSDPDSEAKCVTALFSYKDKLVKTALLEVKSYGNTKISALLGEILYESIILDLADLETFDNFTKPLLLPIPMTRKSRRIRGFNQCELICEGLVKADIAKSIEVSFFILKKIRETDDQVGKSRSERFGNLKNCFGVCNPEKISGRNVIVFDDIVTTGATLNEARKVLVDAGAKKVYLVAFAH
jgi:competence protein ComFC